MKFRNNMVTTTTSGQTATPTPGKRHHFRFTEANDRNKNMEKDQRLGGRRQNKYKIKNECLYSDFRVAEKLISPSSNTHA